MRFITVPIKWSLSLLLVFRLFGLDTSYALEQDPRPILAIIDIDDTAKDSRVRHFFQALIRAFDTSPVLEGMPEFTHVVKNNSKQNLIYYVSDAPKFLLTRSHSLFLSRHNFAPAEQIILRGKVWRSDFKLHTWTRLIKEHPEYDIVIIGDNAKDDAQTSIDVINAFPERSIRSFIRRAYLNIPDLSHPNLHYHESPEDLRLAVTTKISACQGLDVAKK